jgi:hypothetical protein
MRLRLGAGATVALIAFLASGASASAATEIGDECVASVAPADITVVLTASAGSLPTTAASDGVITKWRTKLPEGVPTTFPTKLKVLTPQAAPDDFRVDADSAAEQVGSGTLTFNTRLPIQAGDRIGLYSSTGTVVCGAEPAASTVGGIMGEVAAGSTATFTSSANTSVPVVATVEPDADRDGFGDETQDLCPQNAQTQVACPTIELSLFGTPGRGSLTVVVTANPQAEVTLAGKAKVPGSKRAKLKGGTKTVAPGGLTKFKVRYPGSMKKALAEVPATKSIKAKLTASTTNVLGEQVTAKTTVKVPGTG